MDGGAARLDFHTVAEPEPGEAWRASFTSMWFYTAVYFPATGRAEYRWPDDVMMTQSFDEAKERL